MSLAAVCVCLTHSAVSESDGTDHDRTKGGEGVANTGKGRESCLEV